MDGQQSSAVPPAATSFMTRMTNIFTAPSELYNEVAVAPVQTTSWLIPFLITLFLVIVGVYSVYNNPALRQQIWDVQEQKMKEQVEKKNMTQEQMDLQLDRMQNSGPVMFMAFGAGFGSIGVAFMFFGVALLLWLITKLGFKFSGPYNKILEVVGLATIIGILGSIITLITMNLMNSMYATPGPGLAMVGSFDLKNPVHKLLAALNVFTIWEIAVMGIGIAKVSGKSIGVGIGLLLGLWFIWIACSAFLF
jgi:hypothetical protein